MARNILMDVKGLVGTGPVQLSVAHKRNADSADPSRDVYGPGRFLHMETGPSPGHPDFSQSHPHTYEFTRDMPSGLLARDGSSLSRFPGLPVEASPPAVPGSRRNLFVDVEEMIGSGLLLSAVLVPGRKTGPPVPDFLHCLFDEDGMLAGDLSQPSVHLWEYLSGVPGYMRRGDGGPIHVFLGQRVYETEPAPPEVPP